MECDRRPAVLLLSGGLDSATALAIAQKSGFDVFAITFRYGQRHAVEIEIAKRLAQRYGVKRHTIVDIDLRPFGNSALTSEIPVPKDRGTEEMASGIPVTYVPARNTIFLSFALAFAEIVEAFDIFAGMNALDYAGYPDCRPEYLAAFQAMANLATKAAVEGRRQLRLHTPLIALSKAEIIRKGLELGVDFSLTSSCYDPFPNGEACGRCDACVLRLDGFRQNGVCDPISYRVPEFAKS
jgi:7-cyano-7-deazaguanine synthase